MVSATSQFRVAKAAPKVAHRKMAYLCRDFTNQETKTKEFDVGHQIVTCVRTHARTHTRVHSHKHNQKHNHSHSHNHAHIGC